MTIIALWVKRLILLVLLATFLELLLPDNAYQKYVRLSMGLLILLTLLTPVLDLFHNPITYDQLTRIYQGGDGGQAMDMGRIQALSKQLVSYQDEATTSYVETQIKDLVTKQVEQQYQTPVQSVDVKLKKDQENKQSIEQIVVTLQPKGQTKENTVVGQGKGEVKAVDPVKPVESNANPADKTESVPVIQEQSPQLKKIASGIATTWSLQEQQVFVKWTQPGEGK